MNQHFYPIIKKDINKIFKKKKKEKKGTKCHLGKEKININPPNYLMTKCKKFSY